MKMMNKKCSDCKDWKLLENFSKNKSMQDGLCNTCKGCDKIRRELFKQCNPQKIKDRSLKYIAENQEVLKQKKKNYYQKNRVRIIQENLSKRNCRFINDPLFKLSHNIRSLINISFRNRNWKKDSKTQVIVGCNFEFLKKHLIDTFIQNYGREIQDVDEIHIDHIIPVSNAKDRESLVRLNHFSNLQYLLAEDNLKKSNKLIEVI